MSRLWGNHGELSKKNDDHNAPRMPRSSAPWQPTTRVPRRRSILRLVAYACIIFLLVMTLSNFANTRSDTTVHVPDETPRNPPSTNSDDGSKIVQVENKKTYKGPVKLPGLGESLHAIAGTQGKQTINRNVLFAAASLKSAATLLPMAVQMACDRQNYVHFALMGRSDIPIKELLKINGVNNDCKMILHDARPDHAAISTETRMMLCTARALHHINMYMHPQAILVDSTRDEENYFLSGIRDQVRSIKSSLIELPDRPGTRLSWISKLDSASLAAWDKVHVDIVVHAPPNGVGNLQRLLKSLSEVDMGGMSIPHLTIELPNVIEPQLDKFLARYQWPPPTGISGHRPHMLSLRHRIPRQRLTEEESSVRFLESFWPKNPAYSHVLVLSPHTEVTPQFLHYMKYSLLHYRHSNAALIQNWHMKLMGLSFVSPTTLLDSSGQLQLPKPNNDAGESFLWQAPSSDATLFIGSKWVELHGFVSQVLERQYASSSTPALLAQKEVSKKYPSWLEYILQLSRIRGYYTAYPGRETTSVIMGVHNDIPEVPEEYEDDEQARRDAEGKGVEDEATYLFDPHWQVDILQTLPKSGSIPYLTLLPILTWDGKEVSAEELDRDSREFTHRFRTEVGHCPENEAPGPAVRGANDLFCKASDDA